MAYSRRAVLAGAAAFGLSACVGGGTAGPVAAESWPSVPNAGFDDWLSGMQARAAAIGGSIQVNSSEQGSTVTLIVLLKPVANDAL